jgi:hypothetical protein
MSANTILLPSIATGPVSSSTGRSLPMSTSKLPVVQLTPGRKKSSLLTRNSINTNDNQDIDFEIKDYQGIVAKSALENELLHAGYVPLSKIVIQDSEGNRKIQYVKALNKKGQKVFILLDVNGYITTRSTDLILIETNKAQVVPYSLKMGAVDCAGTEVCGIAFECGSSSLCVLSRDPEDLTPKETNFVFIEQNETALGIIIPTEHIEHTGQIMAYPVIRLSEIRANPNLILENTDLVTRRLRNTSYKILVDDLKSFDKSIEELRTNFDTFMSTREKDATRLNRTLNQLDQWNEIYMIHPPTTDDFKERYRNLQFNLSQRNEKIEILLRSMKKVADLRTEIDSISKTITDITEFFNKEFTYIDCSIPQ